MSDKRFEKSRTVGTFSLEFFPPKGVSAERALCTGAHALRRLQPAFQTVTFSAGGDGGNATEECMDWCKQLQGLTETATASHVALCHFERDELFEFSDQLAQASINHLVLLRGDVERKDGNGCAGFRSVAEAAKALKARHGFEISVAAYPEVHPKALSADADMDVLLRKQDAGADRAITQFFFDNNDFYAFLERAERTGVTIPIVPGVIPINRFERIAGFAEKCGSRVPDALRARFENAGDNADQQTAVAREVVQRQVADLARNGVEHIHIYTLNRTDLAADAIRAFQAEFPSATDGADGSTGHELRMVG